MNLLDTLESAIQAFESLHNAKNGVCVDTKPNTTVPTHDSRVVLLSSAGETLIISTYYANFDGIIPLLREGPR